MRNPVTAFAEWAVKRTDWHRQMMAELESARIDNAIDRMIMETTLAQATTKAKVESVDHLKVIEDLVAWVDNLKNNRRIRG